MRQDAHVHFGSRERLPELQEYRERLNLDHVDLVSLPVEGNLFNREISYVLNKDSKHYSGYGCFDWSRKKDLTSQVNELFDSGFAGIKLWIGKPSIERKYNISLVDSHLAKALDIAIDKKMKLLVHIADPPTMWEDGGEYAVPGFRSYESYMDLIEIFIARFSSSEIQVAHLGFLFRNLDNMKRMLDTYPNLMLDTAPGRWFYRKLSEDRGKAMTILTENRKRIVPGSDAMFFPRDYTMFPYKTLEENIAIFEDMEKFFTTGEEIIDPFPWKDGIKKKLQGLNIDFTWR